MKVKWISRDPDCNGTYEWPENLSIGAASLYIRTSPTNIIEIFKNCGKAPDYPGTFVAGPFETREDARTTYLVLSRVL